jgi:hypothetical protein
MRPGTRATTRRVSIPDDVCDLRALAAHHLHLREDNLWVGLILVPLALTALAPLGQWWTWPVMLLGVAAISPSWRWLWLLALELAFVGAQWAYVGAVSLGRSDDVTLVAIGWIAFPTALAGAGVVSWRRHHRRQMRR